MSASAADLPVAILAGGMGTRLRSVLADRPKPMAQVAGRPFLEWLLLYLLAQGFVRFTICTGHLADAVEDHFGDGSAWGVGISYAREEEPLGTAGALRNALEVIGHGRFFALNGDSLCAFDPDAMLFAHVPGTLGTMWLVKSMDVARFGNVRLGSDGTVTEYREKRAAGGEGLVNAGVYLMEPALLAGQTTGRHMSLEDDVFPRMPPGTLRGVVGDGPLLDIGTPESLAAAFRFIEGHAGMFEPLTARRA